MLGLDLAWSARNRSGLAALDECGRLLDVRADLRSDADILAWIRAHLAPTTYIGIDMPTIVRNAGGARPCETALRTVFGRYHAGPHPANLARFPGGGRAASLIDALRADRFEERIDVRPRSRGRFAFEVFPHPAHVRLFDLPRIFRYKKKPSRSWDMVMAEFRRYRRAMASLAEAEPPLHVDARLPARIARSGYKRHEDMIDAITCAYIASWVFRWGMQEPHVRVFGDLQNGYIVVPDRKAVSR